jgi:hypothetical protein
MLLQEELDTPSVSHLLYLDVKLERYSHLLQALVDCSSSINLIHESIVSALKIPVKPCVGPKVSLADGKTTLSYNSYVVLSYSVAGHPKAGYLLCLLYRGSTHDSSVCLGSKELILLSTGYRKPWSSGHCLNKSSVSISFTLLFLCLSHVPLLYLLHSPHLHRSLCLLRFFFVTCHIPSLSSPYYPSYKMYQLQARQIILYSVINITDISTALDLALSTFYDGSD